MQIGILNPLEGFPASLEHSSGPFSGGLPKKLEIGEQFSVYFPVTKSWFQEDHLIDFGFSDTFDRNHWCPRKYGKKLRESVLFEKDNSS